MYCKFCGNENENGYAFCAYCGRELKKSGSLNAYGSDEKAAENYSAKEDAGIIGNSCNEDGSCAEHTVYDDKNDGQSSRDWEFDTTKEDNAGSSGTDASSLGKPDVNDEDNKNSYTYKKNKKRPGRKKAAAAGIIAAAAIIIIIIIAAAAGKKTKIDVTDYITVEFDGADGYGTAEISGEDEWAVEVGLLLIEEGGYEKALEWAVSLADVSVTYELSQAEGLSNGDIVTVTAVIENADVSGLPVKLTASEVKVEVSGLKEVKVIDLFDGLEFSYSGSAPFATAYTATSSIYSGVYYTLSDNTGLDVGDTFTVTAVYDADNLLEEGYMAQNDTMEVTVTAEDVSVYVQYISEIPEEDMDEMKNQAEDILNSEIANNWSTGEKLESMEYTGCCLLVAKEIYADSVGDGQSGMDGNILILVYKISVWNDEDGYLTYYTCVVYENLLLDTDGSFTVSLDGGEMTENKYHTESGYYYYY